MHLQGGVVGSSVRGGVVFLAREVAGPLLRWCFKSQEERDSVLHATLAPLHHTLQHSSVGMLGGFYIHGNVHLTN